MSFFAPGPLENQIFSSLLKLHKVTLYLKSTQYKKLAPNALWFTSCKSHEKIKQRTSDSSFQFFINKSITLMFFVLFFHVVCKISNQFTTSRLHIQIHTCETVFKSICTKSCFSEFPWWLIVFGGCLSVGVIYLWGLFVMAFPVVEFSREGYKIRKVFG